MEQGTSQVTVYGFRVFDEGVERPQLMGFKATRQAIEGAFEGEIIEGTAEQVDAAELDARGCFVRVPTGWGELGPA